MRTVKGIIFDMDNTILRSNIDFDAMKQETYQFLVSKGILCAELDVTAHTSSTIIELAISTNAMSADMIKDMWGVPAKHEIRGMKDADLEPGALELLKELQYDYCMVIVTNNALEAANQALINNGIRHYFDCVVGREMMSALKPDPCGNKLILSQYRHIAAENWIAIGDAWIDGIAAKRAGIDFVLYQGDIEKLLKQDVKPVAHIHDIRELLNVIT